MGVKRVACIWILMLFFGNLAVAGSFGAMQEISEGIDLDVALHVPTDFSSFSGELGGSFGVLPNFDLTLCFSEFSVENGEFHWHGAWLMPRYDLGELAILEYNILALSLGYYSGEFTNFTFGFEYHTELSLVKEIFSIEINIAVPVFPKVLLTGIVAPVVSFESFTGIPVSAYFEADLETDLESFGYHLIAGIDVYIEPFELNVGYDFSGEIVGFLGFGFKL
ncbi:MAG: hypothetical protein ABDH28_01110 [Brevinematia bacterium]